MPFRRSFSFEWLLNDLLTYPLLFQHDLLNMIPSHDHRRPQRVMERAPKLGPKREQSVEEAYQALFRALHEQEEDEEEGLRKVLKI